MRKQAGTASTNSASSAADAPRKRAGSLRALWENVWVQRAVTWGVLLIAWELFGRAVGPFFFPTFTSTVASFGTLVTDGSLVTVAGSFTQMFAGYGLAIVVGVPLGLLIGSSRIVEWVLGMYVKALFVTSLAALLPFVIILAGTDFAFRVAVVFLFSVFYTIMNPAAGVRSINPGLKEMAAAFNASKTKVFFSLTMPATLPFIMAGLRLALGQAVQGMIIAELWITVATGGLLTKLAFARELAEFFALTVVVVVIGAALGQALLWLEGRLTLWATDVRSSLGALG
jgi:ABC-type nitrate/sulfonate/bicarbonate transport system permease component